MLKRSVNMPKDTEKPNAGEVVLARRLAEETSITEAEAADLVTVLGTDWSSLVREGGIIRRRKQRLVQPSST
jgi:hypothetical protein